LEQGRAANVEEAILGEAHDTWLQGLGLDIDKLREAAGNGAPPSFSPSVTDPALPRRNRNALRHGRYAANAIAERRRLRELRREARELVERV
jgi:hypothetical protein